jgi:hypothetical protein
MGAAARGPRLAPRRCVSHRPTIATESEPLDARTVKRKKSTVEKCSHYYGLPMCLYVGDIPEGGVDTSAPAASCVIHVPARLVCYITSKSIIIF